MVEAPAAATSLSAALYGQGPLPTDSGLYQIRLSRAVDSEGEAGIGYVEILPGRRACRRDSFKTRTVYQQGRAWTNTGTTQGTTARRATVALTEVLLPRSALLRPWRWLAGPPPGPRSINAGVLALP